jgi:hypothetical protein
VPWQSLTTDARPMRFEEIVNVCGGCVTRTQVREAGANLFRTGELDRMIWFARTGFCHSKC